VFSEHMQTCVMFAGHTGQISRVASHPVHTTLTKVSVSARDPYRVTWANLQSS